MNDFSKYPEFERDPEYIVGKDVTFKSIDCEYKMTLLVCGFDPWRGLHEVYPHNYQDLNKEDQEEEEKIAEAIYGVGLFGWIAI